MSYDKAGPPDDFSRKMKAAYSKVRRQLTEQGTWKDMDAPTLALLIRSWDRAERVREELGDTLTAEGSKEQVIAHPLLRVLRDAEQDAHRYATDLLLTPAARAGKNIKEPVKGGKLDL